MNGVLICPVCRGCLKETDKSLVCDNGHSFDIAKEGYVNLISGAHKSGDVMGDNKSMARSRKEFLDKGYYSPLADAVGRLLSKYSLNAENVMDICCGEGYYTQYLHDNFAQCKYYGFDLSKEMVRLAAKRKCAERFFVANIASIPVCDESMDFAFHLFAPFHANEFYRIMKPGGILVTAVPGKNHLLGMKKVLYDIPYVNDERAPDIGDFIPCDIVKVHDTVTLCSKEDILALFQMTPYYYHTPTSGIKRLNATDELKTEIEFVLYVMKK